MKIVFSQVAPWAVGFNPKLRNGYRTRFAQVGERYFRISAQHLNDMWYIEEINQDGSDYAVPRAGMTYNEAALAVAHGDFTALAFGVHGYVFRLSEARDVIAAETFTN